MNTLLRAINKEKNKIKLFPVSFYEDKLAIIYDYENNQETFLPHIIEGIMEHTHDNARIIATSDGQFSEIQSYQEVIMEKGEIKLSKKLDLIEEKK
jgi:hypothetical protein